MKCQHGSSSKMPVRPAWIVLSLLILSVSCVSTETPRTTSSQESATHTAVPTRTTAPSETAIEVSISPKDSGSDVQATDTPEPQNEPGFVPVDFSLLPERLELTEVAKTIPKDVLREISYSGGMGGAGNPCEGANYDKPTIIAELPIMLEWGETLSVDHCGWRPNEEVTYQLISQSGEVITEGDAGVRDDGSGFRIFTEIELNTNPGKYRFAVKGVSGETQIDVEIHVPDGPRVYRDSGTGDYILYNFQSEERVRLLVYGEVNDVHYQSIDKSFSRFINWGEFQTNQDGQLRVKIDDTPVMDQAFASTYIFVGDISGEMGISKDYNILTTSDIPAYIPTEEELEKTESIWNRFKYKDLLKPGTQTYKLNIQPDKAFIWRFSWCGADYKTLGKILEPLEVKFLIDGEPLVEGQFDVVEGKSSTGWKCRRWITLIPEWPLNTDVELDIYYTLDRDIFDGTTTYPAGEYHQVIKLNVGE